VPRLSLSILQAPAELSLLMRGGGQTEEVVIGSSLSCRLGMCGDGAVLYLDPPGKQSQFFTSKQQTQSLWEQTTPDHLELICLQNRSLLPTTACSSYALVYGLMRLYWHAIRLGFVYFWWSC